MGRQRDEEIAERMDAALGQIAELEEMLKREQEARRRADELLADMAAPILRIEQITIAWLRSWARCVRDYLGHEYFDEQFLGKPILLNEKKIDGG